MVSFDRKSRSRLAAARHPVLAWAAVIGLLAGCSPAVPPAPPSESTIRSTAPTTVAPSAPASPVATASASPSAEAGITWSYAAPGFERSFIRVPRDYADPDGVQIPISIGRRVATDPARRIGTLVYLPGGPGDEGVEALRNEAEILFTDAVRERFDVVAFDARGNPVDGLEPNVRCVLDGESSEFAGDLRTTPVADLLEQMLADNRRLADACVTGSGGILPLIGTANVVQDIDRLREALGEDQLSFVGISYGTVTGQLYAERYPERVRAMILDAPMDLGADAASATRESVTTRQRLFDGFLAACATDPACAIHNGGQPREAFEGLVARLASVPLDRISAADLWTVVFFGLREPDQLDEELAAIAAGDTAATVRSLESFDDPSLDGYSLGITCLDLDSSRAVDAVLDDVAALRTDAPDFAWQAVGEATCAGWPVTAGRAAAPVHALGSPPILVLGSTDDPSTPYAWAEAVAGELDSGVLVTRVGTDHGSLQLDNPCIDGLTDAYLLDLEAPANGVRCQ